jgi:hypothetical protein
LYARYGWASREVGKLGTPSADITTSGRVSPGNAGDRQERGVRAGLALSAVALALVALCAGFIPAHRASRVDPMRGLKYE